MVDLPAKQDVCAVFVTYHPDEGFPERVERIRGQVGHVVIVDNASSAEIRRTLASLRSARLTVIENPENRGVAAALNQGVRAAEERGFSWVVTFDQDSAADPRLIESLLGVCANLPSRDLARLGVLGSNHVDQNTGAMYLPVSEGAAGFEERKTVITSGSLIPVAAYEAIGPFREDFFIDGVDHEYCLRARANGFRVLISVAPRLVHAMGNRRTERPLPGFAVDTVNYTPFRWYFIVKNRLTLVTEYARHEPTWAAARAGRLLTQLASTLALEPRRLEKARCMALGAWDFLTHHEVRTPEEIGA